MDFNEFKVAIYLEAPARAVLDCWLCASRLEKWFLASALFVSSDGRVRDTTRPAEKGDSYTWEWIEGTKEKGFIKRVTQDSFSFTFGADVLVEVTVEEGTRTLLSLVQKNTSLSESSNQDVYVSCLSGWTFYLANLRAYLSHGIDLREQKPDRKDLINV